MVTNLHYKFLERQGGAYLHMQQKQNNFQQLSRQKISSQMSLTFGCFAVNFVKERDAIFWSFSFAQEHVSCATQACCFILSMSPPISFSHTTCFVTASHRQKKSLGPYHSESFPSCGVSKEFDITYRLKLSVPLGFFLYTPICKMYYVF